MAGDEVGELVNAREAAAVLDHLDVLLEPALANTGADDGFASGVCDGGVGHHYLFQFVLPVIEIVPDRLESGSYLT